MTNAAAEFLAMAFAPLLPPLQQAVIDTAAVKQLGLRTGMASAVIPNAWDFGHLPAPLDDSGRDAGKILEIDDDTLPVRCGPPGCSNAN